MKNLSKFLKGINDKKTSTKKKFIYIPSGFLRTVHNTEDDFAKTAKLFETAQETLADVTFNDKIFTSRLLIIAATSMNNSEIHLDEESANMKQIATESKLRDCGKRFFENFGLENSATNA